MQAVSIEPPKRRRTASRDWDRILNGLTHDVTDEFNNLPHARNLIFYHAHRLGVQCRVWQLANRIYAKANWGW